MNKKKLVVIGNGMAGARAVEEVLARGGGSMFDIVMFGGEPYGNYNRILLSNVLNGSQSPNDIMINPLDWYQENSIRLHRGQFIIDVDCASKAVMSRQGTVERYDKLLIASGSRAFIPR
jgi:nitrite reductase (NADH) large subunit